MKLALIEEYERTENRIKRVQEFLDSMPSDSQVHIRVESETEDIKVALLDSSDFITFNEHYKKLRLA